jgi:hypothetical protein
LRQQLAHAGSLLLDRHRDWSVAEFPVQGGWREVRLLEASFRGSNDRGFQQHRYLQSRSEKRSTEIS